MGRAIPFNEMTRTQQRHFQRNYGQMIRQQQYAKHSKEECVGKSKFEHRKNDDDDDDDDDDDTGQLITIQFGTMPLVVENNYLLANEFKSKSHDEETMEESKEVCTLELGEGTSIENQMISVNNEEEDNGITDVEEEINLEADRRD
ncbi:hypothetical protein Adt_05475 [Abeliophyllum distichum]|uniref:Uncharacterized protein n=1 Tax=Abeliophyllum distichum TaxID=126358 RepID=A0ABD1V471_9LAMI